MFQLSKLRDHSSSFFIVQQPKPHGHGSEDARFIHWLTVFIESERKAVFVRGPEDSVYQRFLVFELFGQLPADVFPSYQMAQT